MATGYTDDQLRERISKKLGIREFSYSIEGKSLDARKKTDIHWLIRVGVSSPQIGTGKPDVRPTITIPRKRRNESAVVVGSGPAGFFCALFLQEAGFSTTILERGTNVTDRARGIAIFEKTGRFDPKANYAFGEGGAGTFSDGKLTSRSKHISAERRFILDEYINAGAPEEIAYLSHPHLGSDTLRVVVENLRRRYEAAGGTIRFETRLTDLEIRNGIVVSAIGDTDQFTADYFVIAPGHSAYETYRMLLRRGVAIKPKNFAVGSRVEHPQETINIAQWGTPALAGVKAAEYRLSANPPGYLPVYTFCMCPGGVIVPASAYEGTNIVNGMSLYQRNGTFANAACVAAVNPYELVGENASAESVLDWVEALETAFSEYAATSGNRYGAPFCTITDFIHRRGPGAGRNTSYPLGLIPAPLWELLPETVSSSMRAGLVEFCRTIDGFDTGIIMGLESKTSAPVQVLREENRNCTGIRNLYVAGEGSGFAGGIISSAADGVRAAMAICE